MASVRLKRINDQARERHEGWPMLLDGDEQVLLLKRLSGKKLTDPERGHLAEVVARLERKKK
jgi:hypothetical protein